MEAVFFIHGNCGAHGESRKEIYTEITEYTERTEKVYTLRRLKDI